MDIILFNGNIYTMDTGVPSASAIAIKDGVIKAVGRDIDILALKTSTAKVIDLKKKTVVPGFNDNHLHALWYGNSLSRADLSGIKSVSEIQERLRSYINKGKNENGWIIGQGWLDSLFPDKPLTARELDHVSETLPIVIIRGCRHVLVANSKAMQLAGLTKDSISEPGGSIGRYSNGLPNGVLKEKAMSLISAGAGSFSVDEIKERLKAAADEMVKMGVTSISSDDFRDDFRKIESKDVYKAYCELVKEKKLPVRVTQQCYVDKPDDARDTLSIPQSDASIKNIYKLGPAKIMGDGALSARTAYLLNDYSDCPGHKGDKYYTQGQMDELVSIAHNNGRQAVIHAIGDGAAEMALNAIERAQSLDPDKKLRHGIVHCQITTLEQLKRFKELETLALVQPVTLESDIDTAVSRVGHERMLSSYNLKTMVDTGVNLSLGTDCPVDPVNPLFNIYAAVTRRKRNCFPEEGFYPSQCLSVHEAVYAYTAGSAYSTFDEDIKGTLIPGKMADMAVLSDDIFRIASNEIKDVKVCMTIMNGEVIFES